ncbi:MAG: DNA-processing protein DprA [Mycoplasma sp.]|nr:DNA-processing protein DprA [Mycoplasma sp.]
MNIILIYFSIKYKGDWDLIYKALEDKEKVKLDDLRTLEKSLEQNKMNAITILDMEYPNQLKKAYKPPFVIFYEGNKDLLKQKFTCATGNYLNKDIEKWVNDSIPHTKDKKAIITPLQKGVDELIYKENKLPSCIVLASGIDVLACSILKNEIRENTLVISEYPPETTVKKERTRGRNRIIAAMAEELILFSSNKKSSLMNLVTQFLNQGKEIYCFPEYSENSGNIELIKQGANLITKIEEIN